MTSSGSTRAGTPPGDQSDTSRPLTGPPTPSPTPRTSDQAFLLCESWDGPRASKFFLLQHRLSKVKTSVQLSKGGIYIKCPGIESLLPSWDPFQFSPPAWLLRLDPRQGISRLLDARAIPKRITIIIKNELLHELKHARFSPIDEVAAPRPHSATTSSFGRDRGSQPAMSRVIFTFSNWRDLHVALRSVISLGPPESEVSQFAELWIDPDLFQPSNFCPRCGDSCHTSFSEDCPAKKEKARFCGFCGDTAHKVFNCVRRARSRELFASLAIEHLISVGYDDRLTNFTQAWEQSKTYDPEDNSLLPPNLIPVPLSPPPPPAEVGEHKMDVSVELEHKMYVSPLPEGDLFPVDDSIFCGPSSRAIEVTHPRSDVSIFLREEALNLLGQQVFDILIGDLQLPPDSVYFLQPPAKHIDLSLPLTLQGISPGCRLSIQGRLLGQGIQKQIHSFFPPAEAKEAVEQCEAKYNEIIVATWNCRSADPFWQADRINDLKHFLQDSQVDVLAIQEVRFPCIHVQGFETVPFPFSKGSQGTTLLIKETLSWKKNHRMTKMFSRIKEVECTVVDITTTKAPITLGSFYIHPSASGDSITQVCKLAVETGVTLYGDFNAKGAFNGQGEHSNTIGKAIDRFLDSCISCQLVFPDKPTFIKPSGEGVYEATLDGSFCSDPLSSVIVTRVSNDLDSDHSPVIFEHHFAYPTIAFLASGPVEKFQLKNIDSKKFIAELESRSPPVAFPRSASELNDLARLAETTIHDALQASLCPRKTNHSRVPFWDIQLQKLKKAKIRAKKNRKMGLLKMLRRTFKSCFHAKRKKWQAQVCSELNPSNAWTITKQLTGRHRKAAKSKPPDVLPSSSGSIAEKLTAQFAAISNDRTISLDRPDEPEPPPPPPPTLDPDGLQSFLDSCPDEVIRRAIYKPQVSSSPGADCIPAGVLRLCWSSLTGQSLLKNLVLGSLSLSTCPERWKHAVVHPIPKENGEFRPISLLSQISKICERLVTWLLQQEIELSPNQYGCRSKLSALDAARVAHHRSAVNAAKNWRTGAIFLDISKAYDRVNSAVLLRDLSEKHNVPTYLQAWIQSWLSDRSIAVRYRSQTGLPTKVLYGIPQGSPLSVLLFQLYINDIPIENQDLLFMDDCCLIESSPTTTGLYKALQARLKLIEEWARSKSISFNVTKCKLLPHQRKASSPLTFFDYPLKAYESVTYLGITFSAPADSRSPWGLHRHASNLCATVRQRSQIFKYLRNPRFKFSHQILKMIFDGWIGGIINYSNPILAHCPDSKLEVAYRLGLKTFMGLPLSTPNSVVYAAAKSAPLFDQRHAKSFSSAGRLLCMPRDHPFSAEFWNWVDADSDYACQLSTLTLERDALPNISSQLTSQGTRERYSQSPAALTPQPLLVVPSILVQSPGPLDSPCHFSIWTDGGFIYDAEQGSAALAIWNGADHPSSSPLFESSTCIFPASSSTQAEMFALTKALEWIRDNAQALDVHVYSDSWSSLKFLHTSYYTSSLSAIKNRLASSYVQASQVARITLVHVPGHAGITQNVYVDRLASQTLKTFHSPENPLDYSYFPGFARDFLEVPSDYALLPRTPRSLPLQTAISITRCSAALASFVLKMIYDVGFSRSRRLRLGITDDDRCRRCLAEAETPEHLWSCQRDPTSSFEEFIQDFSPETAREWMHSLQDCLVHC